MKNNKVVLILERANGNLAVNKDSGEYILEGVFAQFGVENNNKRIYEEKEYLPHLEYLKKQIAENRLMGELDHPEKFEVSLQRVSHVVESLEYVPQKRQIIGRVRLLNTPAGQIAKNLVDSGIPISISSRAAGIVKENKKVEIKRIFTYDLVAHPGFENAQLTRINESFGLDSDDNIQIFDASAWNPPIFETQETQETQEIKETIHMKEYVTQEAMQKYSILLKEEFEKINQAIEELRESFKNFDVERIKKLETSVAQLKEYANYLSEEIENNREYANYLSEELNHSIDYTESEVGGYVNKVVEYLEEEIVPHMEKIIRHNNHIVNEFNNHIDDAQDNFETTQKLIEYNNYLAEEIEKNRAYANYIAENAVANQEFEKLVEYTEFMFENYAGDTSNKTENSTKSKKVFESNKDLPTSHDLQDRFTSINNKIDAVLEQIKKEKINKLTEDKRYPFLKLLSESKRADFAKLDETQKEKVSKVLMQSKSFNAQELESLYESALSSEAQTKEPKWLTRAPEKFKKIYESLSDERKELIHKAAAWYDGKLETDYQIKNFWETRGLEETPVIESLNENQQNKEASAYTLGYANDVVKSIAEALRKRK